jgi:lysozyme family protein
MIVSPLKDCTPGHLLGLCPCKHATPANSTFTRDERTTLEPECPIGVCLLPITGEGGDVMGPRFPLPGFARQFGTDLRTLACRRWRGGPTLSQRALALDRVGGSLFLAALLATSLWLADRTGLLPITADSAQAATSEPAALDPALAAKPLTSAEVRLLQRKLKSLGFDPGGVDGVPGRRTLAALNAYLASAKLDTATQVNRASAASLLE